MPGAAQQYPLPLPGRPLPGPPALGRRMPRPRPRDWFRIRSTPAPPGSVTIAPRIGVEAPPEATIPVPAADDLAGAWALAWAYADEHAPGSRLSSRGLAIAAFHAIADAVDGDECGPDTLHGQEILARTDGLDQYTRESDVT